MTTCLIVRQGVQWHTLGAGIDKHGALVQLTREAKVIGGKACTGATW
jgi:hypothetical protein